MNKFFLITLAFLIFGLSFWLGGFRYEQSLRQISKPFEDRVGADLELAGEIIREPDVRENTTLLTFRESKTEAKILLTTSRFDEVKYGDLVKVKGKLAKPKNFETDSGREFDYVNYLLKEGVVYQMFYPEVVVTSQDQGNFVIKKLYLIKSFFLHKLAQVIPEPEVSLLGGLILGAKQSLGGEWLENFRRSGVIHMVVLSGYNIAVVGRGVSLALSRLPILTQVLGTGGGILAIVLMAGAGAATVRAGLMAAVALIAIAFHQPYNAGRALVLVGVAMVWWNPLILIHDLGFQLSFISTFGLIYFSPIIKKYLNWCPERFGLRELLATSLAAQLAVSPWLVYQMGELSLVALPANILIVLLVPYVMGLGFLTGLISLAWPFVAQVVAYPTYLILAYQLKLTEWFGNLRFAVATFPKFPLTLTVGFYILIFALYFQFKKK